jgi:obg-like ATPase 1
VYKYDDLKAEEAPLNESKLKASGRQLRVGKSYMVEDGDVLLIKAAKGNNR